MPVQIYNTVFTSLAALSGAALPLLVWIYKNFCPQIIVQFTNPSFDANAFCAFWAPTLRQWADTTIGAFSREEATLQWASLSKESRFISILSAVLFFALLARRYQSTLSGVLGETKQSLDRLFIKLLGWVQEVALYVYIATFSIREVKSE